MHISECNPFVRAAEVQPAVLEGASPRIAYDHRIFLILDGEGTIYIGEQAYSLKENSLILIPPENEYYFRGKMKVAVINYDVTRAFQNQRKPICPVPRAEYDSALRFDPETADSFTAPLVLTAESAERESVMGIVSAFSSGSPYGDARASATLKLLLTALLERQTLKRDPGTRLLEELLLYIRSNAADIRSNEELGRVFGYHPIYLAAVIKEKTGKSLHQTILEERIRLACGFLRSTDSSVEQIAFDTGFSSRNHFCTVFRKMMGITPLTYRNEIQKGAL